MDADRGDRCLWLIEYVDDRQVRAVVGKHGRDTFGSGTPIHRNHDVDRARFPPVDGRCYGLRVTSDRIEGPDLIAIVIRPCRERRSFEDPAQGRVEVEREIQGRVL